jgi:DNA repair photolyase
MNHSTSQLSSRGAMPTPARPSPCDVDWSHRWRRLRDAIVSPEERVLRSARRGRAVILGTAAEPWEALPDRRKLLSSLDGYAGLRLRFTCRTDRVLEDAEILAWLDRDHAVRVEFRLDADRLLRQGFHSPYVERICRALQELASRGLETRLVLEPKGGAMGRGTKSVVARLASALARAGAADLLLTDDAPAEWWRLVEPLRLAHGFAAAAGRSSLAARG